MNVHDVQEQLPCLLRQIFGLKVELVSYEVGNQHPDYLVLLIQLEHPAMKVVVKIAGPAAPLACPFDRTAMLHRLVAQRTTTDRRKSTYHSNTGQPAVNTGVSRFRLDIEW
jgi:hypothetical protein